MAKMFKKNVKEGDRRPLQRGFRLLIFFRIMMVAGRFFLRDFLRVCVLYEIFFVRKFMLL